jgi:hypothetical protein
LIDCKNLHKCHGVPYPAQQEKGEKKEFPWLCEGNNISYWLNIFNSKGLKMEVRI